MSKTFRLSALAAAVVSALPFAASAQQLEEIIVTATRRESDLQSTPLSIQAFSAEKLELAGLERGQDLGIMVPNLVANPQGGGVGAPTFYVRGLPGVGIYIDGVWQSSYGFLESNFAEVERVEVLRGPQGTLFGRNTNGGAINITTRRPGDEFGVRMGFEVGEFDRRNASIAVDLPLGEKLKSKWMLSSFKNDGFLESLTVPRSLGDQDDQLLRFDLLWEPTDRFSVRFTANDEDKAGTEARIVRITNESNVRYVQYNVMAGNPDYVNIPGFTPINWGFPANAFTPETHMPGYPGGELGKWQTKSDTPAQGITRDVTYLTATASWDITDNLTFESISSSWELKRRQSVDFDGSEFVITTDENRAVDSNFTQEFHLTGTNLNGRLDWIAGFYSLRERSKVRTYRWPMLDFPRSPTNPNAFRADVATYLNAWYAAAGSPPLQGGAIAANPAAFIDTLNKTESDQKAFFGEVTVGVTEKLDVTLGVRVTDDEGRSIPYTPTDGFLPKLPGAEPVGDIYAGYAGAANENPDFGSNVTNKYAIQYQLTDDLMLYGSWSEGFTETTATNPRLPTAVNGQCPAVLVATPFALPREVITNREIGMRSDWLDKQLRFNATYFDADWDNMRVNNLPVDPCTGSPSPNPYLTADGGGVADGWEFELTLAATDRLRFDVNLGTLNTAYTARGSFDGTNGIGPNTPFAYSPENTASFGVQYDIPSSKGAWVVAGNYGWRDEYTRDNANQRTPIDANGNYIMEPSYGVLNSRVVYTPNEGNWSATVWSTNLTDEQYVNGGFDTRYVWGYDFSVIGRSREVGIGLNVNF